MDRSVAALGLLVPFYPLRRVPSLYVRGSSGCQKLGWGGYGSVSMTGKKKLGLLAPFRDDFELFQTMLALFRIELKNGSLLRYSFVEGLTRVLVGCAYTEQPSAAPHRRMNTSD